MSWLVVEGKTIKNIQERMGWWYKGINICVMSLKTWVPQNFRKKKLDSTSFFVENLVFHKPFLWKSMGSTIFSLGKVDFH